MAIKMRVLYASKQKKIVEMANMIKAEYQLDINAVDTIPPAYSCNRERLVILMLSLKGDIEDQLRLFCQELTKDRTTNVALVIEGKDSYAATMKEILSKAGTNVADEVFYVKGSFLPFMGSVSAEEKADLLAWTARIVADLK